MTTFPNITIWKAAIFAGGTAPHVFTPKIVGITQRSGGEPLLTVLYQPLNPATNRGI
jgi:hypothetical protein